MAVASSVVSPLPRTSPMIRRVLPAVRAREKRSPPILVPASAAWYQDAMRSGPAVSGIGGSRTRWVASETYRARVSSPRWWSRSRQKTTSSTESATMEPIWTIRFSVPSTPRASPMHTRVSTASSPMNPVSRGPPNEAVNAGATTSSGPRWTSGGDSTSATAITAITASAIATRPARGRHERHPTSHCRASILPAYRRCGRRARRKPRRVEGGQAERRGGAQKRATPA